MTFAHWKKKKDKTDRITAVDGETEILLKISRYELFLSKRK